MPNYNNYSISNGKGKLYLKSSEPKEGYEKVTYGTNGESVTYHKYVDRIQGVLKYFDQKDAQTKDGKKLQFLEVTFIDGEDNNKISVPLKNSKSNFTDEVKALLSSLNSAEVGENYTLSVTKTKSTGKNGKEYENLNVYLNYVDRLGENGKGLSTGFIAYGDIPTPEKEEDEDLGTTWNWKPVNKFYAQKIKEFQERFQNAPKQEQNNSAPQPKVETPLPIATAEQAFEMTEQKPNPNMQELPF